MAAQLDNDIDSNFAGSEGSETGSVTSTICRGRFESGRRCQSFCGVPGWYAVPSDENQFESFEAGHLHYIILNHEHKNLLFRAPISNKAQNILDLGFSDGSWPIDVADRFPNITVDGVDLHPPPQKWVPPNRILNLDEITKPWATQRNLILSTKGKNIHCILTATSLKYHRIMDGSFGHEEFVKVYKRAYDNLFPGGWIEHLEIENTFYCDYSSLRPSSILPPPSSPPTPALINSAAVKAGNPVDIGQDERSS